MSSTIASPRSVSQGYSSMSLTGCRSPSASGRSSWGPCVTMRGQFASACSDDRRRDDLGDGGVGHRGGGRGRGGRLRDGGRGGRWRHVAGHDRRVAGVADRRLVPPPTSVTGPVFVWVCVDVSVRRTVAGGAVARVVREVSPRTGDGVTADGSSPEVGAGTSTPVLATPPSPSPRPSADTGCRAVVGCSGPSSPSSLASATPATASTARTTAEATTARSRRDPAGSAIRGGGGPCKPPSQSAFTRTCPVQPAPSYQRASAGSLSSLYQPALATGPPAKPREPRARQGLTPLTRRGQVERDLDASLSVRTSRRLAGVLVDDQRAHLVAGLAVDEHDRRVAVGPQPVRRPSATSRRARPRTRGPCRSAGTRTRGGRSSYATLRRAGPRRPGGRAAGRARPAGCRGRSWNSSKRRRP